MGSTTYQTEAVLALVKSDVYLGYYPTHCNEFMGGVNQEVLPEVFRYTAPTCMVYRSNRENSTVLREFIDLLSDLARE